MRVHVLILGAALVLGLALTACGQPAPTPTPTAIPTPTAAPTATRVPPAPTIAATPTAIPTRVPPAETPTAASAPPTETPSVPPQKLTVALKALGDSAQTGEAVLTSQGSKTEVVITIKAGAAGVAQPAHIHDKDCTTPGAVKYPLTSVLDGKSTTVIDASLATLQASAFAVRVHKSGPEAAIYISCGEIPQKVTVTMSAVGDSGQSGQAVLTSQGAKTEVVISIKAGAAGVAQPAHIHDKDCTTPGAVKYPLTSVLDGKSTTVIDAPLATLQASAFAVRVHKSGPEAAIYISCGEIPQKVTVTMSAVGDSGQSGQAVLTSQGAKTEVVISIKAGAAGVAQPAHIHDKDCTTAGGVKYPLTSVLDGKSTTVIDAPLATLQASAFAVRVHKSGPEAAIYVACGEIPTTSAGGSSGASSTGPASSTPTAGSGSGYDY